MKWCLEQIKENKQEIILKKKVFVSDNINDIINYIKTYDSVVVNCLEKINDYKYKFVGHDYIIIFLIYPIEVIGGK